MDGAEHVKGCGLVSARALVCRPRDAMLTMTHAAAKMKLWRSKSSILNLQKDDGVVILQEGDFPNQCQKTEALLHTRVEAGISKCAQIKPKNLENWILHNQDVVLIKLKNNPSPL